MEGMNLSGHRARRSLILAAWASGASLSLGGCIYTFQNPAQLLDGGSIVGQVSLVAPATGQTTKGGTVSVLWSGGLSVTLDSSGTFAFLALPDGTYNISTFVPRPAANDFDSLSLLEGLNLPGSPGAVDAVNLSIPVQVSGLVQGTVASGESGVVVAAFFSLDGGPQTYEGYSTTVDGGAYSLLLPAGNHFLYASDSKASSMATISLPAGQTVIQPFTLDGGQSSADGVLQGTLVFGGPTFGASSPPSEINQILPGVTYQAFDPNGQLVGSGTISTTGQGSAGAPFTVTLPAGQPLDVLLFFPSNVATGETFKPLVLRGLPILASGTTFLSQVTWLPVSTWVANGFDAGTGDTYGDGGTNGDGGSDGGDGGLAWERVAFIDAGAGATIQDIVPLPIPLSGGGFGHRVAWTSSSGLVESDDSSGVFSSPQPITGNQPVSGTLTGTVTPSGGNLFAWADNGNNLVAEYYPPLGSSNAVSSPLVTPIGTGHQALSVFSGSQNGTPGSFALLTGIPGALPLLFTSDYLSFTQLTYPTVFEDAGFGNPGLPVTLNTVAASECQVLDLSGLPGFCFIANGNYSINDGGTVQHIVFVGELFTAGAQPQIAILQGLEFVPATAAVALSVLGPDDAGIPSVVVAYDNGGTPRWAQFQTLTTAVNVATAPSSSAIQLLLPYDAPVALSQGVSGGVNTTFLPTSGSPTVDPLNRVQASPLLHGYTDPATGSPVIAVSSQFDQPPQIILYELPVDAGVAPDSGVLPDGGLPDAGLLADSGWTGFGPAIDTVDGGVVVEMLPLPVPLTGGGYGQRVVWAQAPGIDVQADSAYVTDNSGGSFSSPIPLVTQSASPVEDLVGAADSSGNGLAAWIGAANLSLSVATFSAGSSLPTVFLNPDPNTTAVNYLSALPLTVGPSSGFAVVEATNSNPTGAQVVFLSDAGVQTFFVPIPEIDGGCSGLSLAASTCTLSELAGGPGFCLAGECGVGANQAIVFAAAIATSTGSPIVAGHATLLDDVDGGAGLAPPAIVEASNGFVTVEWLDLSGGAPVLAFTQFDNLSQGTYPVTGLSGVAPTVALTTPMPWRGNPLVLFTDQIGGVTSVALPAGTNPVPQISGYSASGNTTLYNQPRAYVDPADGRLIMTLQQPYAASSTTINLFELPP
jgi:hypothetical protein